MSFVRTGSVRKYAKGYSNLYVYWSANTERIVVYSFPGQNKTKDEKGNRQFEGEGHCQIEREDLFELVMTVLGRSGIDLKKEEMAKIAKDLGIELKE